MDIEALEEELEFARENGDAETVAELSEALHNEWAFEMDGSMDDCYYDGPEYY